MTPKICCCNDSVPRTVRVLAVGPLGPLAVPIGVGTLDMDEQGDGVTAFDRTYIITGPVQFVAPATFGPLFFYKWTLTRAIWSNGKPLSQTVATLAVKVSLPYFSNEPNAPLGNGLNQQDTVLTVYYTSRRWKYIFDVHTMGYNCALAFVQTTKWGYYRYNYPRVNTDNGRRWLTEALNYYNPIPETWAVAGRSMSKYNGAQLFEGGTFKLNFKSALTASLAANVDASAMQAALEALSTIGAGNIRVNGAWPNFTTTFQGPRTGDNAYIVSDGVLVATDAFSGFTWVKYAAADLLPAGSSLTSARLYNGPGGLILQFNDASGYPSGLGGRRDNDINFAVTWTDSTLTARDYSGTLPDNLALTDEFLEADFLGITDDLLAAGTLNDHFVSQPFYGCTGTIYQAPLVDTYYNWDRSYTYAQKASKGSQAFMFWKYAPGDGQTSWKGAGQKIMVQKQRALIGFFSDGSVPSITQTLVYFSVLDGATLRPNGGFPSCATFLSSAQVTLNNGEPVALEPPDSPGFVEVIAFVDAFTDLTLPPVPDKPVIYACTYQGDGSVLVQMALTEPWLNLDIYRDGVKIDSVAPPAMPPQPAGAPWWGQYYLFSYVDRTGAGNYSCVAWFDSRQPSQASNVAHP